MADGIDVTEGSGKTVATDDISVDGTLAGQVQFIKLVDGTLNGTGSIRVNQAAKANALTVAPASDISDATYIGDIKFGESLPAGTNAIGKLAANSGIDIGDVDVTSIVPGVAATSLGKARDSALGATDTGVMALAVRDDTLTTLTPADGDYVPLRVGSTGKLHVTDANITTCNTGAVVIASGTVTTVSTVTNLSQMGGVAISLNEGTIDTGTQRVSLATDDDAVASLGIIDDWDAVHASAASSDGPQIMGAGYSTGLPIDVGADGDAARICTDRFGRIVRGLMPQNFVEIFDSADASAEANVVKAATVSRKIYILSLTISVDAEMWVKLQDEDSNAITPKFWLKAGGGLVKTYPPEAPLVLDVANKALEVITEGAGNIGVEVTGYLAV
ncbi:hypothetical protein LCGC14_0808190 [marine sediment metagenome]|uniref:Uncharacterized protein n=1 Tax=marine sediment metagenome TaxID=412755 RepID=A0A0F9SV14_9ZZZZ